MKKTVNVISGIILTAFIFGTGVISSKLIHLNSEFVPQVFVTLITELLFSSIAIYIFTKKVNFKFRFQKVKFKFYIYAVLVTIPAFILINIIAIIILKVAGFEIDPSGNGLESISGMSGLQFFIFVFLCASICEEFLFRGFAQNYFEPFKSRGIHFTKNIFISIPVILSGLLFSSAHLILLTGSTSGSMIFRIVLMTWIGGTIAGYFQEKHQNILPAIVVHMTLNLPGLIMSVFI